MTTVRAKRTKRKVKATIRKVIDPQETKDLLEELVEEAEQKIEEKPTGRVPGLTIGSTKTIYTYQDLEKMFPYVSFRPEETIPLTFQGVKVQCFAGFEMHVPKCFKDIYDNHRREKGRHAETLREANMEDLGVLPAGGITAD